MTEFRVLLNFSMAKRLRNKTFVGWNCLLLGIIAALMFADRLILQWSPDFFKKQVVYVYEMEDFVSFANQQDESMEFIPLSDWRDVEVLLEDMAWIIQKDVDYHVISNQDFPPMKWIALHQIISLYDDMILRQKLKPEEYLARQHAQVVPVSMAKEKESSQNQTWAFLLITSIYFVALSYVGLAASDVVYEKSTRMMELILTCVSSTTHLIAKLLSGWLVLIIQVLLLAANVMTAFGLRYRYDKGKGIVTLLYHLNLIPQSDFIDFSDLISLISSNWQIFPKVLLGVLFMLIGVLFVQTILVILSSFISSIEESGTIQSPFYLLFMGVYYLTIFLNTPTHMNAGIGKTLSMLPFFSMLFMPCRMFYYGAEWLEIGMSFTISVCSLFVLWIIGAPIYQLGVLDYSEKPLRFKIQSSLRSFASKFLFQRS